MATDLAVYNSLVEEVVSYYRAWMDHWSGWRMRKAQIRALASGAWETVFPNDVSDIDLPMVANFFRMTIEDGGILFAEQSPMERVFPSGIRDSVRSEQIEQVVNAYTQASGLFNYLEYPGMDMIASGLTAIKTWPRVDPSIGQRLPRQVRVDPDFILPDPNWSPEQPTERCLLVYTEPTSRLEREYPEQIRSLLAKLRGPTDQRARELGYDLSKLVTTTGPPAELTVIEGYSTSMIVRCVYHESPEHGGYEAELLDQRPNETKVCPIQVAHRPNWSREPLGQLDDSKGIVRTENRYMRLLIDYFVDMVYGGKLAWNVKNPTERGPGTVYFALSPDAKMDPITPQVPSFQAFQIIDRLESDARSGMNNPASREGDVQLNKATAAFLTRAQGKLSSGIRALQRSYAVAKRYSNEVALAQDEAWCNQRKTIVGLARGKRFKVTYTPTELIRGDHANVVTYGTSSGLDQPTHNVLWLEKRQARSVSLETYLENDPSIDDVAAELARMSEDAMRDAILEGLMLPTTPLAQRAAAWQAFSEGKDIGDLSTIEDGTSVDEIREAIKGIEKLK